MCVPGAQEIAKIATTVGMIAAKTAINNREIKKEAEYRAQVAINNIKNSQNEAQTQQQIGIEKSREEKISGMKKASMVLAKNASSGADTIYDTNYQNYLDEIEASNNSAQSIIDEYNLKADSYFQKANDYYLDYQNQRKQYKNSFMKNALNSLGSFSSVASNWYSSN